MKLRKLLYVVPFVAAGIALAACSGGGDNPSGSTSAPPTSQSGKSESSTPAPSSSSEDYSGTHTYKNLKYQFNNDAEHTINITNCDSLEDGKFEVPDTIEYNGKNYKVTIVSVTFHTEVKLTSVVLGKYVKQLNPNFAYFCGELTSVTLSESLEKIPDSAFKLCEKLESITLPDGLTEIGEEAFANCKALKSVVIPSSVTTMKKSAFSYCEKLETVTLSTNLTEIAERAFFGCSILEAVEIPAKVTTIGDEAFAYNYGLERLTIGEGVTTIGKEAFYYTSRLAFLDIPDNVTSIGERAFQYSGIVKLTIGKGITSIDDQFQYCNDLIAATVGENVTHVGSTTFESIENRALKEVVNYSKVDFSSHTAATIIEKESDSKYSFKDGYATYIDSNEKVYLHKYYGHEKNVTIPEGFDRIGTEAFLYSDIESVVIPEDIEWIGMYAFKNCRHLTSVTLNDGLESIGYASFANCEALTSITIPDSVVSIGTEAFTGCIALTNVKLSENLETLSAGTFMECTALTTLTIPESVTEIEGNPFYGCKALTTVNFPDSVIELSDILLNNCESFTFNEYKNGKYVGDADNPYKYLVTTISNDATSFQVHPSTISVAYEALGNLADLQTLETPFVGLTKLEGDEYTYAKKCLCEMFGYVGHASDKYYRVFNNSGDRYVPISLTKVTVTKESIEKNAFSSCTSLTEVEVLSVNASIGDYAFSGCSELTKLTLSDSIDWLGEGSFYNCNKLTFQEYGDAYYLPSETKDYVYLIKGSDKSTTSISTHANTRVIGSYAFNDFTSLSTVNLGNEVTIGTSAFNNTAFTSITLPTTLKRIGSFAFYSSNLTSVTIPSGVTTIEYSAFANSDKLTTVTLPSTLTSIGDDAFYYCIKLENINFPGSLESIGDYAFYECRSLTTVALPKSLESIGMAAFYDNTHLTTIYMYADTTDIGERAFSGTTASNRRYNIYKVSNAYDYLSKFDSRYKSFGYNSNRSFYLYDENNDMITSITLPSDLTYIPDGLMMNVKGITAVNIPEGVTDIGEYAFAGCTSLNDFTLPETVRNIHDGALRDLDSSVYKASAGSAGSYIKSATNNYYALVYLPYDSTISDKTVVIAGNVNQSDDNLVDVVIPDSVKYISDEAFMANNSLNTDLASVQLGKGVEWIGEDAFAYCAQLKIITIPKSVKFIDNGALDTYYGAEIFYEGSEADLELVQIVDYNRSLNNEYAIHFNSYPKLTPVTTSSYKYYEDEDHNVYGLSGRYYGSTTTLDLATDFADKKVLSLGNYAFSNTSNLTSVTLPSTLEYIGNYAFKEDNALTSVVIPDGVKYIGLRAFSYCESLTSVTLPKNLLAISDEVFEQCGNLTSITLPEGLVFIGNSAFSHCDGLTEVVIPASVEHVDHNAFSSCSDLAKIIVLCDTAEFGSNSFPSSVKQVVISPNLKLDINAFDTNYSACFDKLYWYGDKEAADALTEEWKNQSRYIFYNTEAENTFYFTSNGAGETAKGNWWYFDTDGKTIIEKVVS